MSVTTCVTGDLLVTVDGGYIVDYGPRGDVAGPPCNSQVIAALEEWFNRPPSTIPSGPAVSTVPDQIAVAVERVQGWVSTARLVGIIVLVLLLVWIVARVAREVTDGPFGRLTAWVFGGVAAVLWWVFGRRRGRRRRDLDDDDRDDRRVFPPAMKADILARAGHRCEWLIPDDDEDLDWWTRCDITAELDADHIVPWSKGGDTTLDNGAALCSAHNRHTKRARLLPDDVVDEMIRRRTSPVLNYIPEETA